MHIGFDARIHFYNRSGISRYIEGLLGSYLALPESNDDRITLVQSWKEKSLKISDKRVVSHSLFTPSHFPFEKASLYLESVNIPDLDFIHCLDFFAPFPTRFLLLYTAFDLYFLRNPSSHSKASYRHYSKFTKCNFQRNHTVCISMSTERDLLELTNAHSERVSVVYPGFCPESVEASPRMIDLVKKKFKLTIPPILMVGTIETRKNYVCALKAYEIVLSQIKKDAPPLCIVGGKGSGADAFLSALKASPVRDKVYLLGSVSQEELAALYQYSQLLLYPSLYEGFGFPILEGFASKTPVITSNVSSMEEIAGNASVLVNPEDAESIAMGILSVLDSIEFSAALIKRGLARVKDFSWERAAREMREVYLKVAMQK